MLPSSSRPISIIYPSGTFISGKKTRIFLFFLLPIFLKITFKFSLYKVNGYLDSVIFDKDMSTLSEVILAATTCDQGWIRANVFVIAIGY